MSQRRGVGGITRRGALVGAGRGGLAIAGLALMPRVAFATAEDVEQAIDQVIGDKKVQTGRITLDMPEIAENGNTVPLTVQVDSPMTKDNYVKTVHVFAAGNPNPEVATFHFTPQSGRAVASTRMRLAKTQDVVAVAEISDGSVYKDQKEVKVTIGGCGG